MASIVNDQQSVSAQSIIAMMESPNKNREILFLSDEAVSTLMMLVAISDEETIFTQLSSFQRDLFLPNESTPLDQLFDLGQSSEILYVALNTMAMTHGKQAAEDMQERLFLSSPIAGMPQEAADYVIEKYRMRREARYQ